MKEKRILIYGVKDEKLEKLKGLIVDSGFSSILVDDYAIDNKVSDLIIESFEPVKGDEKFEIEFLLFINIKDDQLYDFLKILKDKGLYFPNKAILTDNNKRWTLKALLEENKEEHAVMALYSKLRQAIVVGQKLVEDGNDDVELLEKLEKSMDYFHPREFDFEELKRVYNDLAIKINSLLKEA